MIKIMTILLIFLNNANAINYCVISAYGDVCKKHASTFGWGNRGAYYLKCCEDAESYNFYKNNLK